MKLALFAVVLVLFFATGVITLLGIIQRVEIERKYLNALFSALILELITAVLFMFSATDFFSEADLALADEDQSRLTLLEKNYPGLTVPELKTQLDSFAQTDDELRQVTESLRRTEQQAQRMQKQLDEKTAQISLLKAEIESRKAAVLQLSKLQKLFLVRVAELDGKISEWGSTVNFRWRPEEKRDVALMLQEAFKEIGFMQELEIPNDDPLLTHEILVRYQTEKQFKDVGFLTHQTVAFIVDDYLTSANGGIR